MKKQKEPIIITKKLIKIPKESKLQDAGVRVDYISKHYSVTIGFGKGYTAELIIPEDVVDAFPEYFKVIKTNEQ